jgi:hypothetical protein
MTSDQNHKEARKRQVHQQFRLEGEHLVVQGFLEQIKATVEETTLNRSEVKQVSP